MTLPELQERAMSGYQPEVECWSLCLMFMAVGEDMEVRYADRLQQLIEQLGVDLGDDEGADEATWTPELDKG